MRAVVPPAPVAAFDAQKAAQAKAEKAKVAQAKRKVLELSFLTRLYMTLLWGGAILSACAAPLFGKVVPAASFAGGFVLAAALLKGQELIFRGVSAFASDQKGARGAIFVLLAPIKLILLMGFLYLLNRNGLLTPVPLGIGFLTGQLLVVARIMGRFISPNVRSVREVYITPSTSSLR